MDFQILWQQITDNWLLVWMGTFFIGVIIWVFRPGSSAIDADIATIPFRHDDQPADADGHKKELQS